ncbi:suppressor of IKBKE 1 isoform X1 [Eptesicus fuscus]|uniref:suppressor of IKBKE 1 isoform X1 n=1 Tax=Eptesicus fuscus TaxID=29078 RepID=UPI00240406AC|nr:suppressor of IKBKE 1 isoform X1 [Eptesicus fuscus]
MSCTIEKILTDAKTLLERLREHDAAAESLVDQSAALHRRVAAMREAGTALPDQYQEDASDIKDMSKYKPHILLSQENTQIRDLQQENRELWVSLEEHQDALELIMSKYRKQMLQLMVVKKAVDAEPVLKAHQTHSAEIESQIDRICEMGEVMRKAVQVDDDQFCKIQEKLAQLELWKEPSGNPRQILLNTSSGKAWHWMEISATPHPSTRVWTSFWTFVSHAVLISKRVWI